MRQVCETLTSWRSLVQVQLGPLCKSLRHSNLQHKDCSLPISFGVCGLFFHAFPSVSSRVGEQYSQQVFDSHRFGCPSKVTNICRITEESDETRDVFLLPFRRFIATSVQFELADDGILRRCHQHSQRVFGDERFSRCTTHSVPVEWPTSADEHVDFE